MMHCVNRLRRVLALVHMWAMAIGSTVRTGRRGCVIVAKPGIERAEALIDRKTVLLEAAGAWVDFNNALIQRAFAELAVEYFTIGQKHQTAQPIRGTLTIRRREESNPTRGRRHANPRHIAHSWSTRH
jgi:hypothetical protein